jgi:hypothetical protein
MFAQHGYPKATDSLTAIMDRATGNVLRAAAGALKLPEQVLALLPDSLVAQIAERRLEHLLKTRARIDTQVDSIVALLDLIGRPSGAKGGGTDARDPACRS